jgi:hypothetical protein
MGTLVFICPATGQEVETGIEMTPAILAIVQDEPVCCSACLQKHQLSEVPAWIVENRTPRSAAA